jgi:ubiquinone/menaquinone biosynthesis C-methylase UbiE
MAGESVYSEILRNRSQALHGLAWLKTVYRPYICPFEMLLDRIPRGASVFDLGCGSGAFLALVFELKAPSRLGGVEIHSRLLENAHSILSDARPALTVYDGDQFPADLCEYSHITLIDVLHHIPHSKQDAYLTQLLNVCAPGTTLLLKEIDADSHGLVFFNKLHDLVLSREIGSERHSGELTESLRRMGWEILETARERRWVYPHFLIVARKPAATEGAT